VSATQLGIGGLPADPQTETRDFVAGVGTTITREWRGEKSATLSKYQSMLGNVGVREVGYSNAEGRSRVVAKFVRDTDGGGTGVTIVEELLGVDLVRSIYAADTFRTLTNDALFAVLLATENRVAEADIDGYGSWSDTQKELRWQMLHGQESYYETTFVLRVKKQGVRSSALRGIFTGVNTVQALPTLSAGMRELVGTLPAGEWLYRPPQVQYVQRGIWSVESEWNWAEKWSVVYGGTLKGFLT
jgi:hypothetical protein